MKTVTIFKKLKNYPLGTKIFSKLVCLKAPYFATIRPHIYELQSGTCKLRMKKRRSVTNHLGTVHAIAMCNMAELCAGLAIDSSLDSHLRWIPKGMQVKYLKKAESNLECMAQINVQSIELGDNEVEVFVKNLKEEIVFSAKINMYVSKRR